MRLGRAVTIQLVIFTFVALVASTIVIFGYIRLPALLFGAGHYTVTVQLPASGGLYARANVTYRGTEVGRVTDVRLTDSDVEAVLSLRSDVHIPSDLDAQVHSVSGIGEQYVALLPRNGNGPSLKDGDVIPLSHSSIPPDINSLLSAANRGLQAIPPENVATVVNESYDAVGGLGPDLARLVQGSTQLAIDARHNLDPLTTLIDQSRPVLDSQANTSDAISGWASHLANITRQLQANDSAVADLLVKGGSAASEARQLVDRLQPSLPVLLANLVSIDKVAITYQPALEQLLVLLPAGTADLQGIAVANKDNKHPGLYFAFNLNVNLPPPCTTGYLPAQQIRPPNFEDAPDRPSGDLYCRIPKDSPITAVRGARNYPCLNRPGKTAPTVKMCESDEEYVPLNEGTNWKGDPNATFSGQDIPQRAPGAAPPLNKTPPPQQVPVPPIAIAQYDPASGTYIGPDGRIYTQSDLAQSSKGETWQSMLTPPAAN